MLRKAKKKLPGIDVLCANLIIFNENEWYNYKQLSLFIITNELCLMVSCHYVFLVL